MVQVYSSRVEDAILDILIDRAWQEGELRTVLASVWMAGYNEGHVDGHNAARFADMAADFKEKAV